MIATITNLQWGLYVFGYLSAAVIEGMVFCAIFGERSDNTESFWFCLLTATVAILWPITLSLTIVMLGFIFCLGVMPIMIADHIKRCIRK